VPTATKTTTRVEDALRERDARTLKRALPPGSRVKDIESEVRRALATGIRPGALAQYGTDLAVLHVPCPTCKARAGKPCREPNGGGRKPHKSRAHAAGA
jgi:hypothetical protein